MGLAIGLATSCQAPPGGDLVRVAEEELALVHLARDLGWDSVWASHHYLAPEVRMPQPAVWLARLIAETGDMRLGTGILLLPLLTPTEVAETYGSLDVLSGGRLVLGVGLGYREDEFRAFGVARAERVDRFEETLDGLRLLWGADRGRLSAPPVQSPGPPVLIGAEARAGVLRAARLAHGWLASPRLTFRDLEERTADFDAERLRVRPSEPGTVSLGREVICAATRDEATSLAEGFLTPKYETYRSWQPGDGAPAEPSGAPFVVGTPDDCAAALEAYVATGIDELVLRVRWAGMPAAAASRTVELLDTEVVPHLREVCAPGRGRSSPT